MYKQYVSEEIGNLIIDIDLPSNIRQLNLYQSSSQYHDYFRLTTSTFNYALTYMYSSEITKIESSNFFNYFVELKRLYFGSRNLNSEQTPSFTNLHKLTYIRARIHVSNMPILNPTMVCGLENLVYLNLGYSNFERIDKNAFQNTSLTYLNLYNNKITQTEDGTFNSQLRYLHLEGNGIKTITNNIFKGLDDLTRLVLNKNPNFPLDTLLQTKNLRYLYINYNDYTYLDPYVFQQLKELTYVYAQNNPFICDCRLQWAPIIYQNGVRISGNCLEPWNARDVSITSSPLYANCTQTQSYKCFNKSTSCPNNKVCYNTKDSYTCGCSKGYSLYNSGECNDIDECSVPQKCDHGCENTEGSYICTCQDGFKLSSDGYTCEDVNECQDSNGGCEIGCGNTIGSYQCYCEFGIQNYNKTHCSEINKYDECQENLTMLIGMIEKLKMDFEKEREAFHNKSCQDSTNSTQGSSSCVISISTILPISIIINVIQTIVIIAIICFLAKNKFIKINKQDKGNHVKYSRNRSPNDIDNPGQDSSPKDGQQGYYDLNELSQMKYAEKGKYRNLPSNPSSPPENKLALYDNMP